MMVNLMLYLEPNQHGHYVYQPNHILRGFVELNLYDETKIRGCRVDVYGEAHTEWKEDEGTGENRHTVRFRGREACINSETYVFGQRSGELMLMEPGDYKYTFECQLPDDLPSSMCGKYGEISYFAVVFLDTDGTLYEEVKTPFTVVQFDNLNFDDAAKVGQEDENVKKFSCCCINHGSMTFSARIPYSGFAAGCKIPVNIKIMNRGDVKVDNTVVKLKRVVTFVCTEPHYNKRVEDDAVVEERFVGCPARENVEINCEINVPGILLNTSDELSSVIQIRYYLKIKAVIKDSCYSDDAIEFPIKIGTVPIGMNAYDVDGQQIFYPQVSPPLGDFVPTNSFIMEQNTPCYNGFTKHNLSPDDQGNCPRNDLIHHNTAEITSNFISNNVKSEECNEFDERPPSPEKETNEDDQL